MKVLVPVRTYRGGAAQRWQRLSGNGSSSLTSRAYLGAEPPAGLVQRHRRAVIGLEVDGDQAAEAVGSDAAGCELAGSRLVFHRYERILRS